MFCGSCGSSLSKEDLFCGTCGAQQQVASASSVLRNSAVGKTGGVRTNVLSRMTNKQKIAVLSSGGAVVLLVVAYFVARSVNGPSTPDALQTAFNKALESKSASGIERLLDSSETDQNADTLTAFVNSLNDQVIASYEQAMTSVVSEQNNQADLALNQYFGGTDQSPFHLVKKSTWLGTRWYVHIPAAQVQLDSIPGDTIRASIGSLKLSSHSTLLPSVYTVTYTAKNSFGSETDTTAMDISNEIDSSSPTFELSPSQILKQTLSLAVPNVPGATVSINGKPVDLPSQVDGPLVIAPAPTTGTLTVKATVLGVPVTGSLQLQPNQGTVDANQVLNMGVAQQAVKLLYNAASTWSQAFNDHKPSEVAEADPQGSYYRSTVQYIRQNKPTVKQKLEKVVVDPGSVQINTDGISISDSEFYLVGGQENQVNWTYTLAQEPGKNGWWLESNSQYYDWTSPADAQGAITEATFTPDLWSNVGNNGAGTGGSTNTTTNSTDTTGNTSSNTTNANE